METVQATQEQLMEAWENTSLELEELEQLTRISPQADDNLHSLCFTWK